MTAMIDAPLTDVDGSLPTKKSAPGGGLGKYIAIRFLLIFPTILILVTMVFFLMRITGDPITAALGGRLPPDQLAARIHEAGYDQPLLLQYLQYLGQIATGDFGRTISDNIKVTDMLTTYGTATLELAINALVVALLIGIPLGMIAAHRRDKWPDAVLRVLAILGYATPVFFAGLLLKLVFSVGLDWLPVAGRANLVNEIELTSMSSPTGIYWVDAIRSGNMAALGDVVSHSVLPAVTLGVLVGGVFLRLVRTNVIGTLGNDYVEAGRSRGVSEYRLVTKHAYKPALIPIITVMGLQIATLLGGAVLTESTFGWKGLGFQLAQYVTARDFVAVQGIVMLLAVIVALSNFIVDIVAALIDPRVRY
ncbi:MAG: ABC transporter permease [Dermatophilaceae bacterium]